MTASQVFLISAIVILEMYTLIRLWRNQLLTQKQKVINTLLCIVLPVIWNIIVLLLVERKSKLKIVTKGDRKTKKGVDGHSLSSQDHLGGI